MRKTVLPLLLALLMLLLCACAKETPAPAPSDTKTETPAPEVEEPASTAAIQVFTTIGGNGGGDERPSLFRRFP